MEYWGPFSDTPSGGREKILRAVYRLIMEEGYESVSLQRVADEAGLSKATVYHHFDDKEDLMFVFHEIALSWLAEQFTDSDITDPIERLHVLVDRCVLGQLRPEVADEVPVEIEGRRLGEKDPLRGFVEMRTRAIHDPESRSQVEAIDGSIRDALADAVHEGIENGDFRDIDVDRTADRLYTLMLGGLLRRATTDDTDLEAIRDDAYELVDNLRVD